MNKLISVIILVLTSLFVSTNALSLNTASTQKTADIVGPNVAGEFYPQNAKELSSMLDNMLNAADPTMIEKCGILALICPHAGYEYSGKTAAYGYKLIKGFNYKTVVVIGPSHRYSFDGVSVYKNGIFMTPLGGIEVDTDFSQKLLSKEDDVFFDPLAFKNEHSIEVQLPFLQKTLSGFKIVPIVMGDCSLITCQKLAALLYRAIGRRKDVLVIASTDMYHGYSYQEAEKIDHLSLSAIERMDPEQLYYGLRKSELQLCGGLPVVTTLVLAKLAGYNKVELLKYTNSAQVTGKRISGIWTVGYGCLLITKNDKEKAIMLNDSQKAKLLHIARSSIENYLKTGNKLTITETDPALTQVAGAFVTLHRDNSLRGCIGNIIGKQPLYLTVRDMAIESATGDPRFSPVNLPELKDLKIEISVLTPPQRIDSADEIKLGTDGVIVKRGFQSGVFLPQVATETGWTKDEFLSNLCSAKAGLPADAWKDPKTELYTFTATVFSEEK